MISRLQANAYVLRDCLKKQFIKKGVFDLVEIGDKTGVPLIHLRVPTARLLTLVKQNDPLESTRKLMEDIADLCLEEGYVVATSKRHCHEVDNLITTLRICTNVDHSGLELSKCADVLATAWKSSWEKHTQTKRPNLAGSEE